MTDKQDWYVWEDEHGDMFVCDSGGLVCDMDGGTEQDERKARQIVKAVNYHDRLVEHLRNAFDVLYGEGGTFRVSESEALLAELSAHNGGEG